MNSKSSADIRDHSAGVIVFLMMALVFVPIIGAHAAMAWQHEISEMAPRHLVAVLNFALSAF